MSNQKRYSKELSTTHKLVQREKINFARSDFFRNLSVCVFSEEKSASKKYGGITIAKLKVRYVSSFYYKGKSLKEKFHAIWIISMLRNSLCNTFLSYFDWI